jgi:hypothetical protein
MSRRFESKRLCESIDRGALILIALWLQFDQADAALRCGTPRSDQIAGRWLDFRLTGLALHQQRGHRPAVADGLLVRSAPWGRPVRWGASLPAGPD